MTFERISIKRDDLANSQQELQLTTPDLGVDEIRVTIESLGLSANNISYAVTGDMLGYWAHFSVEDNWGVLPVWGFGRVSESNHASINVGERIFGFLPMASEVIFKPDSVSDICFSDTSAQRAGLHPWYTRCYRCGSDPLFSESRTDIQPIMWALFMTGWMMAEELSGKVDCTYISSASSKTAISLAWALRNFDSNNRTVGLTSAGNREFVESLGVYSTVMTYDDITVDDSVTTAAYVDIAGNAQVTSDMHVALNERLFESVLIGGTHRAPSATPLPMPGPAPRFFFIPDVAEQKAADIGFESYHNEFAEAWKPFADWASDWMAFEHGSGIDAIEEGYRANLTGGLPPHQAQLFTWG